MRRFSSNESWSACVLSDEVVDDLSWLLCVHIRQWLRWTQSRRVVPGSYFSGWRTLAHVTIHVTQLWPNLTRAPLGYFYNAPHWMGGYFEPTSDLRNYWTDSKNSSGIWKPWENYYRRNQILITSGSPVTSQVRSKSKCSTFRSWWHRQAKFRC